MKVIVLLSAYNGEKYIKEQIDSILNQKGDFEINILVRDDGSQDGTKAILQEYADKGHIHWYTGTNMKPAQSFFHLLLHCEEHDYYAFCDQDDIWDNDKLEVAVSVLKQENGYACYYSNARMMDAQGIRQESLVYSHVPASVEKKENLLNELCTGAAMGCTMVINNNLVEVFRKYGLPEQVIMHDSFIKSVCAALGGSNLFDGEPHMYYRQHENNVVGRSAGFWNAIKFRWNYIFKKREVTCRDQAGAILVLYKNLLSRQAIKILENVRDYNRNVKNRINLACSKSLEFTSIKDSVFVRLTILCGRR